MKAIFKYVLLENGFEALSMGIDPGAQEISVSLPAGAFALKLAPQGDDICIWALVSLDEPRDAKATYRVVATGKRLPDDWSLRWLYVDTIFAGPYVWHFFELLT
jgi:hypothetical protein